MVRVLKWFLSSFFVLPILAVAQGPTPPQGVVTVPSAPSTCSTIPLKVVNGTNDLYGTNGLGGCSQIGGSTTLPGGANGQIQYNNSGAFGGASGGTTNGTHWAFGVGSVVDGANAVDVGGAPLPSAAVENIQETSTDEGSEYGIISNITFNPTTPYSNVAIAVGGFAVTEGTQWNNELGAVAGFFQVQNQATGTGDNAINLMGGGDNELGNMSSGEINTGYGNYSSAANFSSGTIDTANGMFSQVVQKGNGAIGVANEYDALFVSVGGGATTTNVYGFHVETPSITAPDVITNNAVGVQIDAQSQTGITHAYGIKQDGPNDVNQFTGPINAAKLNDLSLCSSMASPAACGSAWSGVVQVAASVTSLVIDSTAITANTGCWFTYDTEGITAPTNIASLITPYISARTAGTSITITLPVAPVANPVNIQFGCMN